MEKVRWWLMYLRIQSICYFLISNTKLKLKNDRFDSLNGIMTNIGTIEAEKVPQIREFMNILENEKEMMIKFTEDFDALREKYIGLASANKLKRNIVEIRFPFTEKCNKRRDPRKR